MKLPSIAGLFFIGMLYQTTIYGMGQIPVFNIVVLSSGSWLIGLVVASIADSLDTLASIAKNVQEPK